MREALVKVWVGLDGESTTANQLRVVNDDLALLIAHAVSVAERLACASIPDAKLLVGFVSTQIILSPSVPRRQLHEAWQDALSQLSTIVAITPEPPVFPEPEGKPRKK